MAMLDFSRIDVTTEHSTTGDFALSGDAFMQLSAPRNAFGGPVRYPKVILDSPRREKTSKALSIQERFFLCPYEGITERDALIFGRRAHRPDDRN